MAAEGRADLGASVTGDARPAENMDASSAVRRSVVEDRSSLRGKRGLCREESDIADGRRPGGMVDVVFVEVFDSVVSWRFAVESEVIPVCPAADGSEARVDEGESEADLDGF